MLTILERYIGSVEFCEKAFNLKEILWNMEIDNQLAFIKAFRDANDNDQTAIVAKIGKTKLISKSEILFH